LRILWFFSAIHFVKGNFCSGDHHKYKSKKRACCSFLRKMKSALELKKKSPKKFFSLFFPSKIVIDWEIQEK